MGNLLDVVIQVVLAGLIFWLVVWFIGWVGVPEPFNKVIKVVVGLVAVVYLVRVLLGMM